MKNVGLGCLSLAFILVVVYAIWVQHPRVHQPQMIEEAIAAAQARFDSHQSQANDPDNNGYLDPTFLPTWGRRSTELVVGCPAEKTITAWNESFSSANNNERIDHQALIAAGDPKVLKTRDEFLALVPTLVEALGKPHFVAPMTELTLETELPNLIGLRSAALAISGYLEHQAASGRYEDFAPTLSALFTACENIESQSMILGLMMATAVRAIGYEAVKGVLDPETPLTVEQWTALANAFLGHVPDRELYYYAMQTEIYLFNRTMDDLARGKSQGGSSGNIPIPGFMAREKRIYLNVMGKILEAAKNHQPYPYPAGKLDLTFNNFFTGRVGILSSISMPANYGPEGLLKEGRHKAMGMGLALGLIAYEKEKGKFPERLQQLAEVGVKIEGLDLGMAGYTVSDEGARLTMPVEPKKYQSSEKSWADDRWVNYSGKEVFYEL